MPPSRHIDSVEQGANQTGLTIFHFLTAVVGPCLSCVLNTSFYSSLIRVSYFFHQPLSLYINLYILLFRCLFSVFFQYVRSAFLFSSRFLPFHHLSSPVSYYFLCPLIPPFSFVRFIFLLLIFALSSYFSFNISYFHFYPYSHFLSLFPSSYLPFYSHFSSLFLSLTFRFSNFLYIIFLILSYINVSSFSILLLAFRYSFLPFLLLHFYLSIVLLLH